MRRTALREEASGKVEAREYTFTAVFEPLNRVEIVRRNGRKVRRAENPVFPGYQVTVPLLPGLITYGRTLAEAREMARDAIRCHIEGLRKDGERIPDEKSARKEKLRVALSA
jgi:predicted RNA binding protein YcfA (HicA-like mRNA interferase family)/predicted RNase H-like HicB family nuclease